MLKKTAAFVVWVLITLISALRLSPWPMVIFYRHLFDKGGASMNEALATYVPADTSSDTDIGYGVEPKERLDVYWPARGLSHYQVFPTVVWIHGGGFLAGDKEQVANYLKIVASSGYTTVGINYTLAPAARHPGPARQANKAIAFLKANAERFNIDVDRIILAGDSAGAQIAAQLAIALTDPAFAASIGIASSIEAKCLRAVALYCGLYDPNSAATQNPRDGFLKTVAWAYLGIRRLGGADLPPQFSIVRNVNRDMPPLFITAGNADPLVAHSKSLADAAAAVGVPTETLFFPVGHSPPVRHEYQFDLSSAAGQLALRRSLEFFAQHVK